MENDENNATADQDEATEVSKDEEEVIREEEDASEHDYDVKDAGMYTLFCDLSTVYVYCIHLLYIHLHTVELLL